MNKQNKNLENCEQVEIIDKKTGLDKLVYMCAKPFKQRFADYKKHSLHFWTDMVLMATILLLLAVVISLFSFYRTKIVNIVDFNVNYNVTDLVNGQKVKFEIAYHNTSKKITVHDAFVTIKFPEGLHDVEVEHPNYNNLLQTVALGILAPGATGSFNLTGLALSNFGESQKFLFVLNYTNQSGLAQQEFTTREFIIDHSIINLEATVPSTILLGSDFPTILKIKNNSTEAFENLKIKLEFPDSFKQPADDQLIIAKLEPGQEITKEIIGSLNNRAGKDQLFAVALIYRYQDSDITISKSVTKAEVRNSKYVISFVGTENNLNLNPGDQTVVNIKLENGEDFDIKNEQLALNLLGKYLDKQFMEKEYGADFSDTTLNLIKHVGELKAHETKTLTIKVAALPFLYVKDSDAGAQDINLKLDAAFTAPNSDQKFFLSSSNLVVPINSILTIKSSPLFFTKDGDQVGIGSIPPRPGEYTAYWAILELTNGVNKARNVMVTAELPDDAEYNEVFNVTLGAPIRKSGNNIEWYLPELNAYDGILNAAPQARIQIAIVPSDKQIGQVLTLLKNIRVTAVDDRTGFKLNAAAKDVTTAVSTDAKLNQVSK